MLRPPHLTVARPDAVQAWVLNVRANPAVLLQLSGGIFAGTAEEITDSGGLAQARSALCEPVYPMDYGECALHRYWFDTGIPLRVALNAA